MTWLLSVALLFVPKPVVAKRSGLSTCDQRLIKLVKAVSKRTPVVVLECHRGKKRQNWLYRKKRTYLKYPHSRHNKFPSQAVDMAPAPLNWHDEEAFLRFAIIVKEEAEKLKIDLTWGGDWKYFKDMSHFELR